MKKIMLVAGARPNFVKIAPLIRQIKLRDKNLSFCLIHTGQHHDYSMSSVMFEQLGIPSPDYHLGVGGGTHAVQTGTMLIALEDLMIKESPDVVMVVGDVNSTLAAALCASKLGIFIAHVEAGLRSGDRAMPEEVNRVLTDVISDALFVTEESACKNLLNEGVDASKIYFVGNVMVDSLLSNLNALEGITVLNDLGVLQRDYYLCTFHRPVNVDVKENLIKVVDSLIRLAKDKVVVFPVHPRTGNSLQSFGLMEDLSTNSRILILPPQGYFEFQKLLQNAALVLTDSGGIQEECVMFETPCVTVRTSTERPVTIDTGINTLCALEPLEIFNMVMEMKNAERKFIPELWDGNAAKRIIDEIAAT